MASTDFTPWSTLAGFLSSLPTWVPDDDRERVASYAKYEEMYWNDPRQYAIRVLEDEKPLYIPNARTIVDTTAHYLLKGLTVTVGGVADKPGSPPHTKTHEALKAFLDREMFYSRFHTAKHRGVALGDFVMHMTANPAKTEGTRISLVSVDPSRVFPTYDPDAPDKMISCDIIDFVYLPDDPEKQRVKRLRYTMEENGETRRITREEGIYELEPKWWSEDAELVKATLPKGYLDDRITAIPVYWFKNIDWDWLYGSSELKGFEGILQHISQGSTDVQASLSLEGLGVYATDGGRPVDDDGNESDWEVSPGKVMEVPTGSYFRRVEGVGSITPATDQLGYLEAKLREASGLSDVALGRVDVQTAQSGIALAIKFLPTLAKIEERDVAGVSKLKQLFYDWRIWHEVFEFTKLDGEIMVELGDKLPGNRTETVNELNNMVDRKIISRAYYREKMKKLGYDFPEDIEKQIEDELTADAERAALAAPPGLQDNAVDAAAGTKPPPANGGMAEKAAANRSNNRKRPNESSGTEVKVTK